MLNKIIHAIAAVVLFGIPIILSTHNGVLDLTIGGILNAVYLALSQYIKPTASVS